MTTAVRVAAHAKINLFLRILARESSSHHQIETAFALLELADALEVRRVDSGVALEVEGPDLGPVEENLAVRAARAVLDATGNKFGVALRLTKRIPVRAGLGGGSADAAAFAVCFRAFGLPVPLEAALLLQGIIGFGVAVPSTPGFVGVFEAATRVTLAVYAVDPSRAVSYALTYHLTTFLPITLLGLWSLSRLHLRLGDLSAPEENP